MNYRIINFYLFILNMGKIIIVLGHRLYEDKYLMNKTPIISLILKRRLDKCIEIYKKNDIIIVAGGNPAKLKHTEAFMMRKYILENSNINKKNIILENRSNTTIENFKYLDKILSKIKDIKSYIVITSNFHIKKAKRIGNTYNYNFNYINI